MDEILGSLERSREFRSVQKSGPSYRPQIEGLVCTHKRTPNLGKQPDGRRSPRLQDLQGFVSSKWVRAVEIIAMVEHASTLHSGLALQEQKSLSGSGSTSIRDTLLVYHSHPKTRPKQGLIRVYLKLVLGWGWYRRGYLLIP